MRVPFNGSYPITQGFGVNRAAYVQFGLNGHNGIDYGLPCGTPVVAAIDGNVWHGYDAGGYGYYVTVTGGGVETTYAHLSSISVNQGVSVTAGQQIGRSGTTGNSSGCHLHFGVRPLPLSKGNGYLGYVDPAPYLAAKQGTIMTKEEATVLYSLVFPNQPINSGWVQAWTGKNLSDALQQLRDDPSRQAYITRIVNDADKYEHSNPSDAQTKLDKIRQILN